MPRGNCAEVATTAARNSNVARLQTNSPVSRTKTSESFGPSLETLEKALSRLEAMVLHYTHSPHSAPPKA